MKLDLFLRINAVVAILFGLGFVFATGATLSLYDVSVSEEGEYIARFLGAAFLAIGLVSWLAAGAGPSTARDAMLLGFFVGDAVGFVVALLGKLAGLANVMGWVTVIIYLLLALGMGYFRFMNPDSA